MGENDRGAGRAGMLAVAGALAARLGRPVRYALPPQKFKDMREWLCNNTGGRTHV